MMDSYILTINRQSIIYMDVLRDKFIRLTHLLNRWFDVASIRRTWLKNAFELKVDVLNGIISCSKALRWSKSTERGSHTGKITRKRRQSQDKGIKGTTGGRGCRISGGRENPPQLVKGLRSVSLAYMPLVFSSTWAFQLVSGVQSHGGLRWRRCAGNT